MTPLATIPLSEMQECAKPVDVPRKALTGREVTHLWADDRKALGECGARHHALIGSVAAIQEQAKAH